MMAKGAPTPGAGEGGSARPVDAISVFKEAKAVRRRPTDLPRLTGSAVRLAYEASPRLLVVVLAATLVNAALIGVQVVLGKVAIDAVLAGARRGGSIAPALPSLIGLVAATAVSGVLTTLQAQLQRLLGERVQQLMWGRIIDVTTQVELESFEDPAFFDDLQRVRANALIRPVTLSQGMVGLWAGVLTIVVLAVALVVIQPLLLAIMAVGGVPLWLLSRRGARVEFDFAVEQTPNFRLRQYLTDTLTGREEAKEIRASSVGAVLRERWSDAYTRYLEAYELNVRKRLTLAIMGAAATLAVTTLALAVLLRAAFRGDIALGSAGAALIAVRLLASRVTQVFAGVGQMFESSLFLRDFDEFVARRPPAPSTGDAPVAPFSELEVADVHFRYPGSSDEVLRGVSLRLRAGETIALVGENGSGKTTLAKVVAQLHRPTRGAVLWDGRDVQELDRASMRSRIGVIFQDFLRYQLTAGENIGFGRPEAMNDVARVEAAARSGGASDFIERLPAGYSTGLGKEFLGGQDLSGGQWQRLALARGFFRDADLLVLDEPTSALDARSEAQTFEQVQQLAVGKCLLLISHRFSTVRSADCIYVLHEGEVVERGTHDELMRLRGRYAEMFDLQASAYR